ncbi:30S ribosomal protein S10p (S20e) [Candidatus Nasuia deltocephalinicola]|nr:30S ribosomal protein S10p (S20e) [Candidatus Nasuia deltocephalinicola]
MKNKFNIRFFFVSFDFFILNKICLKIIKISKIFKVNYIGPVYLPTKKKIYNILKSPHVNKDSRDQLQISSFKRFFDFISIENFFLSLIKDVYKDYNFDFNFKIL